MNLNPSVICARGPNRLFIIAILSGHALTMNRDRVLELDKIVTFVGHEHSIPPFLSKVEKDCLIRTISSECANACLCYAKDMRAGLENDA